MSAGPTPHAPSGASDDQAAEGRIYNVSGQASGARRRGMAGHAYDLRSSGGGTLVPRYSTGIPPSG